MSTTVSDPAVPVAAPDAPAFDQLYRTEYARVVAIARRVLADRAEAEDVAQDVFAACAGRSNRGEVRSRAWLHTATVRRALNALRSRRRRAAREARVTALNAPLDAAEHARVDPIEALVRDECNKAIRRVMRRLKPRDAALLALRYGGELSYLEIATALDVPPPHVGTLLARAERAFTREVHRSPRALAMALTAALAILLAIVAFPPARAYATALVQQLRISAIATVLEPRGRGDNVSAFAQLARISRVDSQIRRTAAPLLPSIAEASRRSGFHVRVPVVVPDEIRAQQTAYIQPLGMRSAFRLDAAQARSNGLALPRSLDGATITVAVGPFVQVRYGTGLVRDRLPGTGRPTVVVDEIAAPEVTVRGTTLAGIARWLAAQPSVPPASSTQIRALTDPLVTLPLPVRIDRERATQVTVDGVTGYAVTSFFNGSSYVVWVKDGIVYAVGGTYPLERVLAIANSLR